MSPTSLLPPDTDFGFVVGRAGPIRAADFESWEQDPDNPFELIQGWVVPMSPGTFRAGELAVRLAAVLCPVADRHGWQVAFDARHRLPTPPETVVFPELVVHCAPNVELVAGTGTVARVPDLIVEILGRETEKRDRPPAGAKFRAYEASGVREYFCCWPDGTDAAGFRFADDGERFEPLVPDADGCFPSAVLGGRLRLVPPAFVPD